MTAITPATVNTVLEYVDSAIPPYLLSKPLLQRHHFLAVSPDNADEYLAWPSKDRSQAVRLLLQSHPIPPSPLCVNYTADPETILAHVRITPELRLVFLWDSDQSAWLYHNLALMPFPTNSYSNFDDALIALQEDSYSSTPQGGDPDSYWNSYGSDDSDQPSIPTDLEVNPSSEDAYWAQYSTVEGSGDSTLPSPHLVKKKSNGSPAPERVFVPSDEFQIYRVEPYNPLEPPSPEALSRRLAALSPELGVVPLPSSPPLFDDSPTTHSNTASPQLTEVTNNDSSSSPSSRSPRVPANGFPVIDFAGLGLNDSAQGLLRDNIKAMFRLWESTRREDTSTNQDKDIFLAIARQALEQL